MRFQGYCKVALNVGRLPFGLLILNGFARFYFAAVRLFFCISPPKFWHSRPRFCICDSRFCAAYRCRLWKDKIEWGKGQVHCPFVTSVSIRLRGEGVHSVFGRLSSPQVQRIKTENSCSGGLLGVRFPKQSTVIGEQLRRLKLSASLVNHCPTKHSVYCGVIRDLFRSGHLGSVFSDP